MTGSVYDGPTIIIGASGGIGAALVDGERSRRGNDAVIGLARSFGGDGHIDVTDEASISRVAARLKASAIAPNRVIVATGLLHATTPQGERGPEKSLRELDLDWMTQAYQVNTIGPALIAKHFIPLMPRKSPAQFAAISARVGSVSDNRMGGWYGYRAAKAALNMVIRNIAIEWGRRNDQAIAVALHPGTVDTALSAPFQGNVPEGKLFDRAQSAQYLLDVLDGLNPSQSGRIFAWDGQEIMP